jgi:tetratricopeptide (TPR) repeat protein|tara:strand:- start:216 stop:866 length:651 start_codon:yes stop_codon:yes gene_type:complete
MFFYKLLLLLILSFTSAFLNSQSLELKNEFKVTKRLFKEKKFHDALISNDKALQLSNIEFGEKHLTTATLLENKGRLLLELDEFYKAELIFRDVHEIREELINKNHPDIAEALNYLALSLRFQNKLDDAILVHNKVLNMMASVIANNPGQISELTRSSALYRARAYETKGIQLIKQNKLEEAKGNFRIAIKIFERTLGKDKRELIFLKDKLNNLNE